MRVRVSKAYGAYPWRVLLANTDQWMVLAETRHAVLEDVTFHMPNTRALYMDHWYEGRLIHMSGDYREHVPLRDFHDIEFMTIYRHIRLMEDAYFWNGLRFCAEDRRFYDGFSGDAVQRADMMVFYENSAPRYMIGY